MRKSIAIFILVLLAFLGCNRKDSFTQFRESVHAERTLYFEPSTLRMVNLENNADFDDMVKELEKALYLRINKSEGSDSAVAVLREAIAKDGYEEILIFKDKKSDIAVYLLDKKTPVVLAIALTDTIYNVIEMKGMINVAKIPAVLESFNDNTFLNILSLTDQKKSPRQIEPDSTDQKPE